MAITQYVVFSRFIGAGIIMATKEFSSALVLTKIESILLKRKRSIEKVREERIQWRMSTKKLKWFGLVDKGYYTREEAIAWFNSSDCSSWDPYWTIKWECGGGYDRLEKIKKMIEATSMLPTEVITLTEEDANLVFYFDEE